MPASSERREEQPQLVPLFERVIAVATTAVRRAQLVASEAVAVTTAATAASRAAHDAQVRADVTGRSFFDRQADEISAEMLKKRSKALEKLEKKEMKRRRRSQPAATGAGVDVDLDALFADNASQREPSPGGETPPRSVSPADNRAASVAAQPTTGTLNNSTASPTYVRLTPSRFIFPSASLVELHGVLATLVDLTHPTTLSSSDAPSPTLQALRCVVHEAPDATVSELASHQDTGSSTCDTHSTSSTTDSEETRRLTVLERALRALQPLVLDDVAAAMYTMALVANLTAIPDHVLRQGLPVALLWRLTLLVAQRYKSAKRTLHFVLTVLSNLVFAGRALTPVSCRDATRETSDVEVMPTTVPARKWHSTLTAGECALLFELGIPYYTESAVVEAWFVMLCNLVAVHPETIPTFVDMGLVAVVERLLLYHGRQPRVVRHGMQLLANVSMAVTVPVESSTTSRTSLPLEVAQCH